MMTTHVPPTPETFTLKGRHAERLRAGWRDWLTFLPESIEPKRRRRIAVWTGVVFLVVAAGIWVWFSSDPDTPPFIAAAGAIFIGGAAAALAARLLTVLRPRGEKVEVRNAGRVPLVVQDAFAGKVDPASTTTETRDEIREAIAGQRRSMPRYILSEMFDVLATVCLIAGAVLVVGNGVPIAALLFGALALIRCASVYVSLLQLGSSSVLLARVDASEGEAATSPAKDASGHTAPPGDAS